MAKTVQSLIQDEHQAVKDYGEKAKQVSSSSARVIRHIQGEEKEHARELSKLPEKKMTKAAAFHEVFTDKPKTVDRTKSAAGQRKQMIAIALSKAGLSKPGKKK